MVFVCLFLLGGWRGQEEVFLKQQQNRVVCRLLCGWLLRPHELQQEKRKQRTAPVAPNCLGMLPNARTRIRR